MGLIICDVDGTLISSYMDTPRHRYNEWAVLPGRAEHLSALQEQGQRIALATNQAGVAFGYVTEAQVWRKLAAVLVALRLPTDTPMAVCFAHPSAKAYKYRTPVEVARRKPSGTMLHEIMAAVGVYDAVFYVGDRPEDRQAARHAGVGFRWADEFFGNAEDDDVSVEMESGS